MAPTADEHPVDLERARALVLTHGWNTTSYQILNPGFEYWFTPSGDAVVGHVRRKRVWVVGGAPVCAPDRLDETNTNIIRQRALKGNRTKPEPPPPSQ